MFKKVVTQPTPFGKAFLESSAVLFSFGCIHAMESLLGREMRILKQLLCFQKGGNQARRVWWRPCFVETVTWIVS